MKVVDHSGQVFGGCSMKSLALMCALAACGSSNSNKKIDAPGGGSGDGPGNNGDAPVVGACPMFPSNFIFNTPIDSLPVDPNSAAYITSIGGGTHLHLDLGQQTDQTQSDFYWIP